jgi:hypothetical protein
VATIVSSLRSKGFNGPIQLAEVAGSTGGFDYESCGADAPDHLTGRILLHVEEGHACGLAAAVALARCPASLDWDAGAITSGGEAA